MPDDPVPMNGKYLVRGRLLERLRSVLFLMPSWFAPHKSLRGFFHRLRGVQVGKDVEIGYFCVIANVHPSMVTIEDEAVIAAGAKILEHDDSYLYTHHGDLIFGPVKICRRAFVGVNAVIFPNVTVGEGAIVGANSVVRHNVEANTVVGGVPAEVIREFPSGQTRQGM